MVEVKKYQLPPTELIPNNPNPLIHYPGLFATQADRSPADIYDTFLRNGWQTQWIFRYGETQRSHYHSAAHECMTVLTGSATIRFGVADTVEDLEESTHGEGREQGGIEIQANVGDVFILPAGTAHKTFDTDSTFALLTPGDGSGIDAVDKRKALEDIRLSGFTMLGAYPIDSHWDFAVGGDSSGEYEKVWSVPRPSKDPVLGQAPDGICGLWK